MVKSVILKTDNGQLVMGVLSAKDAANLDALKEEIGCRVLRLASETEFRDAFPTCNLGAMPPFGNLYGLSTLVDKHLAEQDYIVFEAGTHTDAIIMNYRDYEKIVNPKVEDFSIKLHPMKGA